MRFTLATTLTMAMMAVACSLLTDLSDLAASDAGASDAIPDVAPDGYALTLSPSAVALNEGDLPVTITINVVRGASFTGPIAFTVAGQPIGITSTPPPPAVNGQTTSSFQLAIAGAQQGQYEVVVTGTSGNLAEQATLALYVDTALTPDDAGVVIVPSWASTLDVKAWGGGGGGGGEGTGPSTTVGAAGGGGGFAAATLPAAPGSKWTLIAGTGGASCVGSCGGGGGGGFSGVMNPVGSWMLIAGAGGGGASANLGSTQAGGGGGGTTGQDAIGTSCPAKGGSQSAGGAGAVDGCTGLGHGSNGAALNGGAAGTFIEGGGGGMPGGGAPSGPSSSWIGGAGGGGGGWFGGGGGVFTGGSSIATGGGGGSGFVDPTGMNPVNAPAAGAACAHTNDPDLKTPCNGGTSGVAGANGLVIVRAKP